MESLKRLRDWEIGEIIDTLAFNMHGYTKSSVTGKYSISLALQKLDSRLNNLQNAKKRLQNKTKELLDIESFDIFDLGQEYEIELDLQVNLRTNIKYDHAELEIYTPKAGNHYLSGSIKSVCDSLRLISHFLDIHIESKDKLMLYRSDEYIQFRRDDINIDFEADDLSSG